MLPSLERLELPRLAEGIERVRLAPEELMIRAPQPPGAAGYLRLEPADERLLDLMDGTRTPAEILVENLRAGGGLAIARLNRLLAALKAGAFLVPPRTDVYAALTQRLTPPRKRSVLSWLKFRPGDLLSIHLVAWRGADAFFARAYRFGGWVLFQSGFIVLATLAAFAGFGLLAAEFLGDRYDLFQTFDSYILGLITLACIDVFVIATHDACHGLAMKHVRRHVIRAGVMLYYFSPVVYVDSTDVWMNPRRQRIIVSWAGPFSGLIIGGIAGFVAAFPPSEFVGEVAFKLAAISFLTSAFNLIPLLELDGYYILVDMLNKPMLRMRSFDALFKEVPRRLGRGLAGLRELSPEQRFLAAFGAASLAFSAVIAASGVALMGRRIVRMADALWADDIYSKVLVVALIGVIAMPLVIAFLSAGRAVAQRPVAFVAAEVRARLPGSLSGALRKTSLFAGLSAADLALLGEHCTQRRVAAGSTIVRQGEPGDEFFIIVSGAASVHVEGRGAVREMGADEFFGELALLERAARTATVLAETPMLLVVLDAGHFRRWTAERPDVRDRIAARIRERDELARLPLFEGVPRGDLDALLGDLESVRFSPGQVLMAEGEAGDALYVVAEGTLEVTQAGNSVRELGPGDYAGEVALLTGRPRTATVTATTEVRAYRVSREGFERMLQTAGKGTILSGMERYPDLAGQN
ncbi:MAG TPA: cyclic nucleotide-binding domain-containing protein [Dehalococcoidia bacterium]|nr:cyclic nucleotide-binding domain-containing protein [Dehalococcoidia bacterium]